MTALLLLAAGLAGSLATIRGTTIRRERAARATHADLVSFIPLAALPIEQLLAPIPGGHRTAR